jgi:hypothetical protein
VPPVTSWEVRVDPGGRAMSTDRQLCSESKEERGE